jgi:hypothetical protein
MVKLERLVPLELMVKLERLVPLELGEQLVPLVLREYRDPPVLVEDLVLRGYRDPLVLGGYRDPLVLYLQLVLITLIMFIGITVAGMWMCMVEFISVEMQVKILKMIIQ